MERFQNRVSQFPNRRKLNVISGAGTNEMVAYIERDEGHITKDGTPITAEALNNMESDIRQDFPNRASQLQSDVLPVATARNTDVAAGFLVVTNIRPVRGPSVNFKAIMARLASASFTEITGGFYQLDNSSFQALSCQAITNANHGSPIVGVYNGFTAIWFNTFSGAHTWCTLSIQLWRTDLPGMQAQNCITQILTLPQPPFPGTYAMDMRVL